MTVTRWHFDTEPEHSDPDGEYVLYAEMQEDMDENERALKRELKESQKRVKDLERLLNDMGWRANP